MHKLALLFTSLLLAGSTSCQSRKATFSLQDFYSEDEALNEQVNIVYDNLNESERIAQMIISSLGRLGKPYAEVKPLIERHKVGGIIFLSGDPEEFKRQIFSINEASLGFPLLMSMDAEPSLFNRRMPGTPDIPPTNELRSEQDIFNAVSIINASLKDIGFQHNYAPVVDVSPNNEAIGNRSMGSDSASIVPLASTFIKATQKDQIVATAKHFPGHGRVAGDTHKKLVYIDGELTEVGIYEPLIEAGVLSIMVGHIAVENNAKYTTAGLPSTLSPIIVNQLLRNEMKFDGIIVTDAMNMGAVSEIENATLLAAKAGCDLILMPPDEAGTLTSILDETKQNPAFKSQVEQSVKRIIRLKLCLGMKFSNL
ncbi:MAG: glycoside hydrolase family 3 N-terminal domain-containing protein [Salibacteraceae bacterium]